MAFDVANLSVTRHPHENGVSKVFTYTTTDDKNTTKGFDYFDERFFAGGDVIKVTHDGGSYLCVWNAFEHGVLEV